MRKQTQLDLFTKTQFAKRATHGGSVRQGKRKLARPIATKHPMHIVMRATKAKGSWSLLKNHNYNLVKRLLFKLSRKYDIHVHHFVNVGNHLHLVVQTKTREKLANFMREFAGGVAMKVTGAKKGKASQGFWDATAFSRVILWGRDFRSLTMYVVRNFIESKNGFWVDVNEFMHDKQLGFG